MEAHFLADIVAGESREAPRPWYNRAGDCLIYQLRADVEIVADRIDQVLTIYRALDTGKAIGFQIKGVSAIVNKFGFDAIGISTSQIGDEIKEVSVIALVMAAFEDGPHSISRLQGYTEAVSTFVPCADMPVAAMDPDELCHA